jgi:hypothetical protein
LASISSEVRTKVNANSFIASRVICEPWYASIFRSRSGNSPSSILAWFPALRCGSTSEGLNSPAGLREHMPLVMAYRKTWLQVFRTRRAMSLAPRPWTSSIMRTTSLGSMWATGLWPITGKTLRSSLPITSSA